MTDVISPEAFQRGTYLMEHADRLTDVRRETSPILGSLIATTDLRLASTLGMLYLLRTDYKDGDEAREGAELLGVETTMEGALKDPEADRELTKQVAQGLMVRFARQGDYASGSLLLMCYSLLQVREQEMAKDRKLAIEFGIDPKAIPINKGKFGLLALGETVMMATGEKQKLLRKVGLGIFAAGVAVGIAGERIFKGRVRKGVKAQLTANAASCPDVIRPFGV